MSRVGKLPIAIPLGLDGNIANNTVSIKGKLGQLVSDFSSDIRIERLEDKIVVSPVGGSIQSRAMWGMARSIISSMVKGVTEGFTIRLEINGVGYKAAIKGNVLTLALGYSHDIKYVIPSAVTVVCEKPTLLVISSASKQKVGQVAAEIMKLRKFNPYKGKGVYKEGLPGRRKVGKKK